MTSLLDKPEPRLLMGFLAYRSSELSQVLKIQGERSRLASFANFGIKSEGSLRQNVENPGEARILFQSQGHMVTDVLKFWEPTANFEIRSEGQLQTF